MLKSTYAVRASAFLASLGVLLASVAVAQIRVERVTDLSDKEVAYPTTLSQLYPGGVSTVGAGSPVSAELTIPGGGSILTQQANTHIDAPDPTSSEQREAVLFDNTFVTFDSLNLWAIDRGSMYIVNQRGRLEILKVGLARILAESELVVNVTPTAVDVYVVSGQVTVESLAVGGAVILTAAMAAQVTTGGAQTVSLTAAQQAAYQQQVQTAQQVMNTGGISSTPVIAGAAAGAAVATVAVLRDTEADVAVNLDADASVEIGNPLTYTLEVLNQGPATANEVRLSVNLPGATVLSVSGASCATGGAVTCDLGSLDNGARISIVISATAESIGQWESVASVTAKEKDPNSSNDTDRGLTTVRPIDASCPDFGGVYQCATFDFISGPGGIPNRLQPGITLTCEGPTGAALGSRARLTNFWTCRSDNSNFITVTGPLDGTRYVGRGFGTYTGLRGVSYSTEGEMITTFDSGTCTLRDGQYRVGSDGSLPGAEPLTWRFQCRKQ